MYKRFAARIICSFVVSLTGSTAYAQQAIWAPDSLVVSGPNFGMERYYGILKYHEPVSYLAYPVIRPVAGRRAPLRNGEGSSGYWLEGHITNRFTVYRGKYYSLPFFQRLRLTFDVGVLSRLTMDTSSPLLPSNNRFGLGMDFLFSPPQNLRKGKPGLLWTTLQLHHYSNGQADSFFIEGPVKRNNYRSGDFSTNYFRALLEYAHQPQGKSIISAGAGYQHEINIGGPLVLNKELFGYYGLQRLLFNFRWVRPSKLTRQHYRKMATPGKDSVIVSRRRQIAFRAEAEYILDNLDLYPSVKKYRLGVHSYFTYMPSVYNDVGLVLHTYAGRDYLNIRFDDIIFMGELGFFVRIR